MSVELFNGKTITELMKIQKEGSEIGNALDPATEYERWEAGLIAVADALKPSWIPVGERLPDPRRPIVLIHDDKYEDYEMGIHISNTGYLGEFGAQKFWSIRGEPARCLEAFTHWMYLMPLPESPK